MLEVVVMEVGEGNVRGGREVGEGKCEVVVMEVGEEKC